MTDLSRELRATLAGRLHADDADARRSARRRPTAPRSSCCASPTAAHIESVFIPDTPAMTFCISTQVGCAMACAFCLTGKMGLVRNLTAGEIVGQVRVLADALDLRDTDLQHRPDGHGRAAPQLRRDDDGAADPDRRARLRDVAAADHALDGRPAAGARAARAAKPVMPNLAISLHAPTDLQRGELVPINKKYGVADIIDAVQALSRSRKRSRITFEYVLLAGVNDSPQDARQLAKLRRAA